MKIRLHIIRGNYTITINFILIKHSCTEVIRLSRVTIRASTTTFTAQFTKLDHSVTFNQQGSTTRISNSSGVAVSSEDNILTYRPNFRNGLATILIHIEAVYPCATQYYHISCKLLPSEDVMHNMALWYILAVWLPYYIN